MSKLNAVFLLLVTGCGSQALTAATIADILIPITISIPTTNLNDNWILCGVPLASCGAGSPLTISDAFEPFEVNGFPAASGVDVIHRVNLDILESGYITFIGLDTAALDHVVLGLRFGFINAGDPWPFATLESQVAADLLAADAGAQARLRTFFNNNLSAFIQIDGNGNGSGGVIYRFSDATVVGSVGAITATPEPSMGALMIVGLLTLAFQSRILAERRSVK